MITVQEAREVHEKFAISDTSINPVEIELSIIQRSIFSVSVYDSIIYCSILYKDNKDKLEQAGFKVDRVYRDENKDMHKISWE